MIEYQLLNRQWIANLNALNLSALNRLNALKFKAWDSKFESGIVQNASKPTEYFSGVPRDAQALTSCSEAIEMVQLICKQIANYFTQFDVHIVCRQMVHKRNHWNEPKGTRAWGSELSSG